MSSLQAVKYKKDDEEADELIRKLQTGQAPEQQPVEPAEPDVQPQGEQNAEPVATPAEPNAADPVPANQNTDEVSKLKDQLAQSEHRYRTLQGMMDKTSDSNRELRQAVQALTEQLTKLQSAPAPEPAKEARLVTDKDEEAFGSDLVDFVRRAAKDTLQSEKGDLHGRVDTVVAEVSKRVDALGEVVAQTATERFDTALTKAVADWQEINLDPQFSEFLGPYGLKALNEAYGNRDVEGTAKFFRDYKVITGKHVTAPAEPPASQKLESLIAPSKTKSASPAPASKPTFTTADWESAFELNRRGKLSDADLETFEKEFFKAQQEGRVIA